MTAFFNRIGDYLLEKALAFECKRAGLASTEARSELLGIK